MGYRFSVVASSEVLDATRLKSADAMVSEVIHVTKLLLLFGEALVEQMTWHALCVYTYRWSCKKSAANRSPEGRAASWSRLVSASLLLLKLHPEVSWD